MPNTSTTGGYLQPSNSEPLSDSALQDFLQSWATGVSGLQPELVRPRWQSTPPNMPPEGTTWAAIGIVRREKSFEPFITHIPTADGGKGIDQLRQHEELHCILSFYGDEADLVSTRVCYGMFVAQNREILQLNNMEIVDCDNPVAVPEIIKSQWLYRIDLPFTIRRQIVLEYAVQNILVATGDIHVDLTTEEYSEKFETQLP